MTAGAAPRGELGGTVPPIPSNFCKLSKTDEKILVYGGMTSPTIPEFLAEFVTSSFQRSGSNLYFIQFLTSFILLNLFIFFFI